MEINLQNLIKSDSSNENNNFPKIKKQTDPKLPQWMRRASIIDISQPNLPLDQIKELSPAIKANLKKMGIVELFPVQLSILLILLQGYRVNFDLCVCAPTGCGKTLAYAIPIVDQLSRRIVRRLRAIVIVPTRELVPQVKSVFDSLAKNTDLIIAGIYGYFKVSSERALLVGESKKIYPGGLSEIDILITTPGRLIDHLSGTINFTLQHLNFLIIDEADRLIRESSYDWLSKTITAIENAQAGTIDFDEFGLPSLLSTNIRSNLTRNISRNAAKPTLQKLLFSATLTSNPAKLATVKLNNPRFFTAASICSFIMPKNLLEYQVLCKEDQKFLAILFLLHKNQFNQCICFCSSIESTTKLYLNLRYFMADTIAEFSGSLTQSERDEIMKNFKAGKIKILVCSDAIARGIDLENVEAVVNHDVPNYIKTYIHRSGRTARAGRAGRVFTLLYSKEFYHFGLMMKKAQRSKPIYKLHFPADLYESKYRKQLKSAAIGTEKIMQIKEKQKSLFIPSIFSKKSKILNIKQNQKTN
eukprot:TRINITY_DN3364_c0_g1_i1.p1 TRINITY_DN3364_c0_g1~~TRINITY_DN3364_c0_g1_i1.p1  ORF type:complete len:589 (-),score=248.23 TRINITY_DN3364_c0_g1_i1:58-1644(-)